MFKIFNNYSAADKAKIYAQKHFSIDGTISLPGNSVKELNNSKLMICNYLRHKNTDVRFFDPRELLNKVATVPNKTENMLAKMVGVEVRKKTLFGTNSEKKIIKYLGRNKENKPFIREVYETVSELSNVQPNFKYYINLTKDKILKKFSR